MHGFYLYEDKKTIRFDLVVDFETKERGKAFAHAMEVARGLYPEYTIVGTIDTDFAAE